MSKPLLQIEALRVEFNTRDGVARVIDDLDIALNSGEILGIVGESGCGKSMTALSIMGLVPTPPGRITSGTIHLADENLLEASEQRMRQVRGNDISMIFQEPMTSLNPVFSIGDQIAETVMLHEKRRRQDAWDWAVEMLEAVGIPDAEQRASEYPHQMSGGMRQRVMIAMALACQPQVLIADEPTTALDVTVQAQIFDLLKELRERTGAAIILITHDMGAIAEMTERVVVMYAGRKVEDGPVDEILAAPRHPYTSGLIACVPHISLEPTSERPLLVEIPGIVPSLTQMGKGCPFAPRCAQAMDKCREDMPPRRRVSVRHSVACWLVEQEGAVA